MKAGLISDTHDNQSKISRALELYQDEGVEAVIHAGDWVAPFSAKRFENYRGRLYGSYGNNDGEVIGLCKAFEEMEAMVKGEFTEFELDGEVMAVVHGTYPPVVEAIAESGRYPVLVYGHTHEPEVREIGDVLLVNPGEACGYLSGRSTVALLDTEEREAIIHEI
jgi:hypothetical protein